MACVLLGACQADDSAAPERPAAASSAAVPVLEAHAGEPVPALVQHCHDALRKTRGAVMSLASFDEASSSMTWAGVGNVEGILFRTAHPREVIAVRGGVVGYQLPRIHADTHPVACGDTLIMVTDGIRAPFTIDALAEYQPQEIAESILARFAKGSDDAHVVVARYLGATP
jgi:hypothetical protein